ncbi:MAG: hypothetical protein FWG89_10805 [Treponema sp.]|nr:hypothetical protein [Treponema sp.]
MKRFVTIAALLALMCLLFTACEEFFPTGEFGDFEEGNPGNFNVRLQRITLNTRGLHAIPGINPTLTLTKFPAFANTGDTLRWTSSNTDVATVDPETGEITTRTAAVTGNPLTTVIAVESLEDPSVRASATLTVYPVYNARRRWLQPASGTAAVHGLPTSTGGLSNIDMGLGAVFNRGTGGGLNSDAQSPGLYIVDPENPYAFGITPTGATLNAGSWATGSWTPQTNTAGNSSAYIRRPFYFHPANYFHTPGSTTAFFTSAQTVSIGHYRAGAHGRVFSIAALQGPFTVIVNYVANGAEDRSAVIRVGDTDSGILDTNPASPTYGRNKPALYKEGETSPNDNNQLGNERSVWYNHHENEFVPIVYIEAPTGNLRFYDLFVLDEVLYQYNQVPFGISISGESAPAVGRTEYFSWVMGTGVGTGNGVLNYTPWLHNIIVDPATNRPMLDADGNEISSTVITWDISAGDENAEIASTFGNLVEVRGLQSGSFTLRVTISTYNPNRTEPGRDADGVPLGTIKTSDAMPNPSPDIIGRSATRTYTIP